VNNDLLPNSGQYTAIIPYQACCNIEKFVIIFIFLLC